jgi:hypothetical protein
MSITPPARSGGFDLVNGGPNEGDIAEAPSCGKAAGFAAQGDEVRLTRFSA